MMGFGMGFRSNMYFSMLADVADYGEWQSGRNLAGTQMAVNGFSNKVSSACASAIVAGLLAILIGTLGIHKFYLGYTKSGIIMLLVSLLTFGVGAPVMAVISLIEGILYLTKSDAEFYQTYVQNKKEWF